MGQKSKAYSLMAIPFTHEMIKFTYWLLLSFTYSISIINVFNEWMSQRFYHLVRLLFEYTYIAHRTMRAESNKTIHKSELVPNICLPNCHCWKIESVFRRQMVSIHIYFWSNYNSINRNGEIFIKVNGQRGFTCSLKWLRSANGRIYSSKLVGSKRIHTGWYFGHFTPTIHWFLVESGQTHNYCLKFIWISSICQGFIQGQFNLSDEDIQIYSMYWPGSIFTTFRTPNGLFFNSISAKTILSWPVWIMTWYDFSIKPYGYSKSKTDKKYEEKLITKVKDMLSRFLFQTYILFLYFLEYSYSSQIQRFITKNERFFDLFYARIEILFRRWTWGLHAFSSFLNSEKPYEWRKNKMENCGSKNGDTIIFSIGYIFANVNFICISAINQDL